MTPDGEMTLVGYTIGLGVALVALPVVPFVLVYLAVARLLGGDEETASEPGPTTGT